MSELIDVEKQVWGSQDQDPWSHVAESKFPERYVEGLERDMAEALWGIFLSDYPGVTVGKDEHMRPTPLYLAAGGFLSHESSWVVGRAGSVIKQARICAEVAKTSLANS